MIGVFIDGANLYHTAKVLNVSIDFKKLLDLFGSNLLRAHYYTATIVRDIDGVSHDNLRPLTDFLSYNGYKVISKDAKSFTDATGKITSKGNMDLDMAMDMVELVGHIDEAWLFTGDGDFVPVVRYVQRRGVRVVVASSVVCKPQMVANELRREADRFVDIANMTSIHEPTKDVKGSRYA